MVSRKGIFWSQSLDTPVFSASCPLGLGWQVGRDFGLCEPILLTTGQLHFSLKPLKIECYWHLRKGVIVLFSWHIHSYEARCNLSCLPKPLWSPQGRDTQAVSF